MAQDWKWQNPLPQGNRLNCIKFANSKVGWAVGSWGTILYTSDEGKNWKIQLSSVKESVKWLTCTDELNCWAVTAKGTILRTTDGGQTWSTLFQDSTFTFKCVTFSDNKSGWVGGSEADYLKDINDEMISMMDQRGIILKTKDGGNTWKPQFKDSLHSFNSIGFYNSTTGWVTGCRCIYKTTNKGESWVSQIGDSAADYANVCVIDSNDCWVSAMGRVLTTQPHIDSINGSGFLHTSNGGSTWKFVLVPNIDRINSSAFTDRNNGWVAGRLDQTIKIVHTTNRGSTWSFQKCELGLVNIDNWRRQVPTNTDVYFLDANNGWMVDNRGSIHHTTNGGTKWVNQREGATCTLNDICFIDKKHGWAVGGDRDEFQRIGKILQTVDGGESWSALDFPIEHILNRIYFYGTENGWAVGEGVVCRTTDGGNTWTQQTGDANLTDISFIDAKNGWVSSGNAILRTTNGGRTWYKQAMDITNRKYAAIEFTDVNTGWVVADSGIILCTTNGGMTWNRQISGTSLQLCNIKFIDQNIGWITGGVSGYDMKKDVTTVIAVVLHTTDGGKSWAIIANNAASIFTAVTFIDTSEGWA